MKLLLLIGFLAAVLSVSGQNYLLPYVKQGHWQLIDTTGKLVVSTPYSYIHTYDSRGFTYFQSNGSYGILDDRGKEVVPALYEDVQQLGKGKYVLKNSSGWLRFQTDRTGAFGAADTMETYELLNDNWAIAGRKDSLFLVNQFSDRRWKIPDTTAVTEFHDHVLLQYNDSIRYLIDGNGNELLSGGFRYTGENGAYYFRLDKQHYLFDARGAWAIPGITKATFQNDGVFVRTANMGTLYDYSRRKVISGDFDDMQPFNETYFIAFRNGWATLIDRATGKQVLPLKYNDIQLGNDGGYFVYRNGFTGTLDAGFREVVPCIFTRFVQKGDLIFSYDERYAGLYSLKTKKEILPAVYDRIQQTDMRFKAYRSDLLTLIELDNNHAVVNRASIDNTITVRLASQAGRNIARVIDPRLFSLGWFLDSTLVTPKNEPSFYAVKWGLADRSDSVLIKPSIPSLLYLASSPYTIQVLGNQSLNVTPMKKITATSFKAIYHETGKTLNKFAIISYDSTDFRNRGFMRVSTFEHFAILRRDGTAQAVSYLEKGTNRYLRYCESKTVELTEKKKPDMTEVPNLYFPSTGRFLNVIAETNATKKIAGLVYPDGRWNFFDETGQPLFKDTFSFTHPFLGQQAIIRKEKGWGVVSPDTIIIPPVYSEITRKIILSDTFFIAKLGQSGMRLLDTTARVDGELFIVKANGTNLLVEEKGKRWIANEARKTVVEGHSSYKFLENGFILAKMKKEYSIFDPEGRLLFECKEPPEQLLSAQLMVLKAGSGFSIYNNSGEAVLDRASSVERKGPFIIVKKEGKTTVYDTLLQPLREKITGRILIDTLQHAFAVTGSSTVSVYAANGKRTARFKGITPDLFIGGRLIVQQGDSSGVFSATGERLLVYPEITEVEVFGSGAVLLKLKTKSSHLFSSNWSPILPEETRFRGLTWYGEHIYAYRNSEDRLVLYNAQQQLSDSSCLAVSGTVVQERLLVKKAGGFTYVDLQFKPVTGSYYQQAQPFSGNFAAVGDKRGWTLIDSGGRPLSYPNFGAITAVHRSLFQTGKLPLYGLFDSKGKTLIPAIYEQLNFLPHNIVQVIKNGEVSYFRMDGTALF